jgi:hypothetical protein
MAEPGAELAGASGRVGAQGWGAAVPRALLMLAVVVVVFGLVPNWLLDRLADRVTTTGRDLILVASWIVGLAACTWLFLVLQGRER